MSFDDLPLGLCNIENRLAQIDAVLAFVSVEKYMNGRISCLIS
jgi:hypothetical protein